MTDAALPPQATSTPLQQPVASALPPAAQPQATYTGITQAQLAAATAAYTAHEIPDPRGGEIAPASVLSYLMAQQGITPVDYLNADAEGGYSYGQLMQFAQAHNIPGYDPVARAQATTGTMAGFNANGSLANPNAPGIQSSPNTNNPNAIYLALHGTPAPYVGAATPTGNLFGDVQFFEATRGFTPTSVAKILPYAYIPKEEQSSPPSSQPPAPTNLADIVANAGGILKEGSPAYAPSLPSPAPEAAAAVSDKTKYASEKSSSIFDTIASDFDKGISFFAPSASAADQKGVSVLGVLAGTPTLPKKAGADYTPMFATGSTAVTSVLGVAPVSNLVEKSGTVTAFVPEGKYVQEQLNNAKIQIDKTTGELGIYEKAYGPHGEDLGFQLIGGGGRNALQSGAFTVNAPETPFVVQQALAGKSALPKVSGYSGLGAEAYGGYVMPLTGALLNPGSAFSQYPNNPNNLANYVNPQGPNLSKTQAPGANIPWSIPASTPAISYFGGVATPASVVGNQIGSKTVGTSDGAIDAGSVIGVNTQSTSPFGASAAEQVTLPKPFVSNAGTPTSSSSEGLPQLVPKDWAERIQQGGSAAVGFSDEMQNIALGFLGLPKLSPIASQDVFVPGTPGVTTSKQSVSYSGGNQTISNLGEYLGTNRPLIDTTNATAVSDFNAKVGQYNLMQQENPVVKTIITSNQTVGGTSDQILPYGQFSRMEVGSGKYFQDISGLSQDKVAAYQQSVQSAPGVAGAFERFAGGEWQFLTDKPLSVAPLAVDTAVITLGSLATGGAIEEIGAGGGFGSGVARALTTPGAAGIPGAVARGVYNYGAPIALTAIGAYQVSEGFTAGPNEIEKNIGASSIPTLAMLGAGGATTSDGSVPEALSRAGNSAIAGLSDRMSIIQEGSQRIDYSAKPDPMMQSGIGGDMTVTLSSRTLSPTIVNVAGYDIPIFPRIRTPGFETDVVSHTNIDVGQMLGQRFDGVETEPLVGTRQATYRLKSSAFEYPGQQPLARGTGELRGGEMRLPQLIRTYQEMGVADSKLMGMSPEEVSASYMANAAAVTTPDTLYRTLDVAVVKGTNVHDAFDWNTNLQGGTEYQLNRQNFEDFSGHMRVVHTGEAPYQIDVTRDLTEQGFGKTGSFDVTGSQVPELKVIRQLQLNSQNLKPGVEYGYAFDSRGNLIHTESGSVGRVSREGVWDALGNVEGKGYAAHTHPPYAEGSVFSNIKADVAGAIKNRDFEYLTNGNMRQAYDEFRGIDKYPSKSDAVVMSINDEQFTQPRVAADLIVSQHGVSIFREPQGGWKQWGSAARLLPKYIDDYSVTDHALIKSIGMDFIGKNERFGLSGFTERIPDATAEMQASYPQGTRNLFLDTIDRMGFKNPNMEFSRDATVRNEPSLSSSGSNLGRGGGANTYYSPSQMAVSKQSEVPLYSYRAPATSEGTLKSVSSEFETIRGGLVSSSVATESVRAMEGRSGFAPFDIQSSGVENVMAFTPASAAISAQPQNQKNNRDNINAYIMGSDTGGISVQSPQQDYVRAFAIGSDVVSVSRNDQIQQPLRDNIPYLDLVPAITPVVTPMPPQTADRVVQTPLPIIPFPTLPFGGGGGGVGGEKRRGKKIQYEFLYIGPRSFKTPKSPKIRMPKKR